MSHRSPAGRPQYAEYGGSDDAGVVHTVASKDISRARKQSVDADIAPSKSFALDTEVRKLFTVPPRFGAGSAASSSAVEELIREAGI